MTGTTRAFKRLGVAGLAGLTLASAPFLNVAPAFAASASLRIISPSIDKGSALNDGTDTKVHLASLLTQATGADTPVASVRFSVRKLAPITDADFNTVVKVGQASSAPYSTDWAAGNGTYQIISEGLDANGVVISGTVETLGNESCNGAGTFGVRQCVVIDNTKPTVHTTYPVEGTSLGYWNPSGADNNTVVLAATRSAGAGTVSVTYNGLAATSSLSASASPDVLTGTAALSDAAVLAAGSTEHPLSLLVGTPDSDHTTAVALYNQTIGGTPALTADQTKPLAVVPPTKSAPFQETVLDQNGKPVAGAKVQINATNTPVGSAPATYENAAGAVVTIGSGQEVTTGPDGKTPPLIVDRTDAGKTSLDYIIDANADNVFGGTGDLTRSTSFTTYAVTITSLGPVTVTPAQATYTPGEYNPAVTTVRVFDQNGAVIKSTVVSSKVAYRVTRTLNGAQPTVIQDSTQAPTPTFSTDAKGDVTVPHTPALNPGDVGQDDYLVYIENNNTPGYQPTGTNADVGVTKTVTFSPGKLVAKPCDVTGETFCYAQQTVGQNKTLTFLYTIAGQPAAGRTLTVDATQQNGANGVFPAIGQPTGTTRVNDARATCVTQPDGTCSVTVVSTTATAGNNSYTRFQVSDGSGVYAADFVYWRNNSVALVSTTVVENNTYSPTNTNAPSPGRPVAVRYELRDSAGQPLRNVPVQFTTDKGFFVAGPSDSKLVADYYSDGPGLDYGTFGRFAFPTAAATGGVVGNPTSIGTSSAPFFTDNAGDVVVILAIGRDTGFDATGKVLATVKATSNSVTKTAATPYTGAYTWTTDGFGESGDNPVNGASVSLVPSSLGILQSNIQQDGDNGPTSLRSRDFVVHLTDQYGNLVRLNYNGVSLTADQAAAGIDNFAAGQTANDAGSFTAGFITTHKLYSLTANFAGDLTKVSAAWNAPTTVFNAVPVLPAPGPVTYTTGTSPKSDSFSVNAYRVDPSAIKDHSLTTTTPSSGTAPVGTTISVSETVRDQFNQGIGGLDVTFLRAGPGTNVLDCTSTSNSLNTNSSGRAGYSTNCPIPGTANIDVIIQDFHGNEIARTVSQVKWTPAVVVVKPRFTIAKNPIIAGGTTTLTVTGTAGDKVQVLARTFPATAYHVTITLTLDGTGTAKLPIAYSRNTSLFVRNAVGSATPQSLVVVSIVSMNVKALGAQGVFYGHVTPAVSGRAIKIYYRLASGTNFSLVASGVTNSTGDYRITHTFRANSKIVAYALRVTDGYNSGNKSAQRALTLGG